MPVLIDGQPVEIDGADLSDVLSAARCHLDPAGRVIVEVELDGEPLDTETMESRRQDPVAGCELKLTSADPGAVAVEVLRNVSAGLSAVRQDQKIAAELLQQDDQAQALQRLSSIIETWQQAQQGVIQSLSLSLIDIDTLKSGERKVPDLLNALADGLRSLRDQLAARDTVAIADALLYEWPAILDQWDMLVAAVIDAIEHRRPSSGQSQP